MEFNNRAKHFKKHVLGLKVDDYQRNEDIVLREKKQWQEFRHVNCEYDYQKAAEENIKNGIKPTDVSTIWVNYYRKMKKILNSQVKTK